MVACERCRFYVKVKGECRHELPQIFIFPSPDGNVKTFSFFPPMRDGFGCGKGELIEDRGADA